MIYPNRYEREPAKRKAYRDACDMIAVYGVSRKNWNYLAFGLNRIEMKEVWGFAEKDMNGKSKVDFIY